MIPYYFHIGALKIKTTLWMISAISLLAVAIDPTVKVALIAAVPPTLLSIVTLIVSVQNRREGQRLHISLNSRLSELIKASKESSHAAGRREGIESKDSASSKKE